MIGVNSVSIDGIELYTDNKGRLHCYCRINGVEQPIACKVGKYWALFIDGVDVLEGKKAIHCGVRFEGRYYKYFNYTDENGVTSDNICFNIPKEK